MNHTEETRLRLSNYLPAAMVWTINGGSGWHQVRRAAKRLYPIILGKGARNGSQHPLHVSHISYPPIQPDMRNSVRH